MTIKSIRIVGTRHAIGPQALFHLVCSGTLAAARMLHRQPSTTEQTSLLPDDAVDQLRRERMRARLPHDDLRISVRRVM
jgi:hypothetical protein